MVILNGGITHSWLDARIMSASRPLVMTTIRDANANGLPFPAGKGATMTTKRRRKRYSPEDVEILYKIITFLVKIGVVIARPLNGNYLEKIK